MLRPRQASRCSSALPTRTASRRRSSRRPAASGCASPPRPITSSPITSGWRRYCDRIECAPCSAAVPRRSAPRLRCSSPSRSSRSCSCRPRTRPICGSCSPGGRKPSRCWSWPCSPRWRWPAAPCVRRGAGCSPCCSASPRCCNSPTRRCSASSTATSTSISTCRMCRACSASSGTRRGRGAAAPGSPRRRSVRSPPSPPSPRCWDWPSAPWRRAGTPPGLKQRDVYVVFFESYGTIVLDEPRYAASVLPALGDFAATVGAAGYHLASSRIVSPTFGGGSWLAHGSVAAGVKLDPLLARLIATSARRTLPRYMSAAGYRTVEIMPGLKTPPPESAFWGFDKSDMAADLGYEGPPFGWFGIPDQYTLARFDATEAAPGHAPLFAQIVLVSSHTPFAPVPPYVADGQEGDLYRGIAPSEWQRIYAPPDWSRLDEPYLASVVYDLKTLAAWLARRPGDGLVVILGDHQPPGFIAGEKQPWTVPIHVLSRDAELVRPFEAAGYAAGAVPPSFGPFKGMETFLGDFLAAFSHPPATVAARRGTPEHVSD